MGVAEKKIDLFDGNIGDGQIMLRHFHFGIKDVVLGGDSLDGGKNAGEICMLKIGLLGKLGDRDG